MRYLIPLMLVLCCNIQKKAEPWWVFDFQTGMCKVAMERSIDLGPDNVMKRYQCTRQDQDGITMLDCLEDSVIGGILIYGRTEADCQRVQGVLRPAQII